MASRVYGSPGVQSANRLPSLAIRSSNWQRWLTAGISLALLVTILTRLDEFGFRQAFSVLPATPAFWLSFAAYYLALPGSEWLIFRRLWTLPASGIVPLLRKLVSNEVLLGYSGEAYFYAWARSHAKLVAAPFGAIKDVSILSALAGNLVTLAMLGLAWPLLANVAPQLHGKTIFVSTAVMLGSSMAILLFRGRLFSLDRAALRSVFSLHLLRLAVTTVLSGVMWHLALPEISIAWLVLLATLQLLVTRLPLIPSKDLVFANLAVFLVGHDNAVTIVVAMIAASILATHLLVGGAVALFDVPAGAPLKAATSGQSSRGVRCE
jgi:hypothetical protein